MRGGAKVYLSPYLSLITADYANLKVASQGKLSVDLCNVSGRYVHKVMKSSLSSV